MNDVGSGNEEDEETAKPVVKTPVTVLSGVLGAGKTTLLKRVLEERHGYRIAVIQNEFSTEMGMEAPLIKDAAGSTFKDIYELPNGCLCCSAKDGLVGTLDVLLEVKGRFDYVLVEATGTADPESICEIFWVDEGLGSRVYLDGVVTLVDARNALSVLGHATEQGSTAGPAAHTAAAAHGDAAGLGLEREAVKQVACADVLILNKLDLVQEAELVQTRGCLANMNPTATLIETRFSAVPLSAILGIQAFQKDRLVASLEGLSLPPQPWPPQSSRPRFCAMHSQSTAGCAGCQGQVLTGAHGVESLLVRGEGLASYDPEKVRAWMADVLWEDVAGRVYRCKGLFSGPPEDEDEEEEEVHQESAHRPDSCAYSLQGVGKLFEIEVAPQVVVEQSKFLFIGRGLRAAVLEAGLRGCRL